MKVVFMLPDLGAGGAERVVTILSRKFVENGIAVDIVMFFSNRVQYEIPKGVGTVKLNTKGMSIVKRLKCLRAYFKEQKRQFGQLVAIPFQDNCLKYALVSRIALGIPVIASERNDPYQKGSAGLARLKAILPYALAKKCVFQTPDARDYYRMGVGRKGVIIENPLIMPEDIFWRGQDSRKIVSVGRLDPQKNQQMLIKAFAGVHEKYPGYVLEIYGEGELRDKLQALIDGMGLRDCVFLRGYASDIHQRLQDAAMFVLSSDFEGMSNALIEALAIGVPTVSTDHPIGGARMLMKDGENGLLTPVGDAEAFENAMCRLLEDPEFARVLGEKSRSIRKRLAVDTVADQWIKIIKG